MAGRKDHVVRCAGGKCFSVFAHQRYGRSCRGSRYVGEIAVPFILREYCRQRIARQSLGLAGARALIRNKEEGALFDDRPSQRSSILILMKHVRLAEEVWIVERRVPEEFERAAVVLIGTRFDDSIQYAAGIPTILRIDGVRNEVEFLNRIRAWNDDWRINGQIV